MFDSSFHHISGLGETGKLTSLLISGETCNKHFFPPLVSYEMSCFTSLLKAYKTGQTLLHVIRIFNHTVLTKKAGHHLK